MEIYDVAYTIGEIRKIFVGGSYKIVSRDFEPMDGIILIEVTAKWVGAIPKFRVVAETEAAQMMFKLKYGVAPRLVL